MIRKSDASSSFVYFIATLYDSDLTQNTLQTLSYDLSGNAAAENNEDFALYFDGFFNGNGTPYIFMDRISVYGTPDPFWTAAEPTSS